VEATLTAIETRIVEQVTTGPGRVRLEKQIVTARIPGGSQLSLVRKRLPGVKARAAVLLLHGFAQNRYTWHLDRRSFSAYLAARGYDVFNLELRGIGRSRDLGAPAPLSFDEHIDEDLPAALSVIERLHSGPIFLMGHSLGGAVAYASAARERDRLRGVVTLSGVFRWGRGTRSIHTLARVLRRFDSVHRRVGVRGLPIRMDWLGRGIARGLRVFDSRFCPLPAQGWAPGSVEQPILREWLTRAFDRTSGSVLAAMGRWAKTGLCDSHGRRDYAAEWATCKVPALILAADRDQLAHPFDDVKPAFDLSSATDRTYRCFGPASARHSYGHIDLLIGRHAPDEVWRTVADWLAKRS
jgi:alpha-beta hydrolase superfamily lysophospholipase